MDLTFGPVDAVDAVVAEVVPINVIGRKEQARNHVPATAANHDARDALDTN